MSGLLVITLLFAVPNGPDFDKSKAQAEHVAELKRSVFKVDRSIEETEALIATSRDAPYLPDLQLRLCELYVEKSRYVYHLRAANRAPGEQGAVVSPEVKLLKQKVITLYDRLLREFPGYAQADRVTFFLAHEQRELGEFAEMLKTLEELNRNFPKSPLRAEASQIVGDYHFDKADLVEAEKHYRAVLETPPSPVHDLARYKLGWIRVNQGKHPEAVTFFEEAARPATGQADGGDAKKALNVKREALLDLVYSYTEARKGTDALAYFEKLSDSRSTYVLALEKLASRYLIKQQPELALPALRKLMELNPDPSLDSERAARIYDALKLAKEKVLPDPVDIRYLVRAATHVKRDPDADPAERQKALVELEEMARDLATQLHLASQRKGDEKLYAMAAAAYGEYLALFRPKKQVATVMRNRADALFAAGDTLAAARQFEELARVVGPKAPKAHEAALYGSLLAYQSALKKSDGLNAFQVAYGRSALKFMGAQFVARYPKSENVPGVKFNIGRAHYDDGQFELSAKQFTAFALQYPSNKDAAVAGHLALDSFRQLKDYPGLEAAAKKLIAAPLPSSFIADARKILTGNRGEAFTELALQSAEETGDVVSGLLKVADANPGQELGEKALYSALTAVRERRDLKAERELAERFVKQYPRSQLVADVLLQVARHAAEAAQFAEAAGYFELAGKRLTDSTGINGWLTAANLRLAMNDYDRAIKDLEAVTHAGAGTRKAEALALLATAALKQGDLARARNAAEQTLQVDALNASAAAVLAEVAARAGGGDSPRELVRLLTQVAQGGGASAEPAARGLWHVGELLFKAYSALPTDALEQRISALRDLEAVYGQVLALGSAEWAVASLWRMAAGYQQLAEAIAQTPLPEGLSPGQVKQFKTAVQEQEAPLRARAEETYKLCLTRATALEVFHPAVLGCRNQSAEAAAPRALALGGAGPSVEELAVRTEQKPDGPSLEALGLAYLRAGRTGLAQLTLSRATELPDHRASSHNALGVALLASGDVMGARAAYGKALEVDPLHAKSRANLAALRCRYGDSAGARKELAQVKDKGALTGVDVDPEWRSCTDAITTR